MPNDGNSDSWEKELLWGKLSLILRLEASAEDAASPDSEAAWLATQVPVGTRTVTTN